MLYDELYALTDQAFGEAADPLLDTHLHRIDPARPVLDIGAGQGRNSFFLARRGFRVDALEPSAVGQQAIERAAREQDLPIRVFRIGFDHFSPASLPYSALLIFGLIPDLTWPALHNLIPRIRQWSAPGTLVFLTAFTTDDPSRADWEREAVRIGPNSFRRESGRVRTFLRPGRLAELLPGFEALELFEGWGPEHCHADGPPERHAVTRGVFRREAPPADGAGC